MVTRLGPGGEGTVVKDRVLRCRIRIAAGTGIATQCLCQAGRPLRRRMGSFVVLKPEPIGAGCEIDADLAEQLHIAVSGVLDGPTRRRLSKVGDEAALDQRAGDTRRHSRALNPE